MSIKMIFSVIITTYNRSQVLMRAIQSVIDQKFQDFELIIVNDGSTENYSKVEEFIKKHKDKIRYFYKENEERSVARNFGVKQAIGDFICFLDDDDYFLNNHLQMLFNEIQKHNNDIAIYHTYSKILIPENKLEQYPIKERIKNYNNIEHYLSNGVMTVNCSCFAKEILLKYPFDSKIKMGEDTTQRTFALMEYPVHEIKEYTSVYDKSMDNSSSEGSLEVHQQFIDTFSSLFSNREVKRKVRKSIRAHILYDLHNYVLNYNRNNISYLSFFRHSFKMLRWKKRRHTVVFLIKALKWKIEKR